MKHTVLILIILFSIVMMTSCKDKPDTVPAVDITGLTLNEAREAIESAYLIKNVDTPTNAYLPGTIIGYADEIEPGDDVEKNATVDVLLASPPEGSFSLSDQIQYAYEVGFITGPESINFDLLQEAGVGGTDLGIPVETTDGMMLLYGDTFSGVGSHSGFWFSNFIAESTDTDLYDGLQFDSVVTTQNGTAQPFMQGLHQRNEPDEESLNPDREVTKIPTGGITINDTTYIFYMSVRYWGVAGAWLVSYNQVIKSTDGLQTWTNVEGLRWNEDEAYNFGQIFAVRGQDDPEMIHLFAIPGGRQGGTVLARVHEDDFENRDAYDYYTGHDTWTQGDTGLVSLDQNPYYVIQPSCSEMSVMYNDYLGKWMAVYLKGSQIIYQTADHITGPYSDTQAIVSSGQYPGLYGGFVHRNYTDYDGQKFYIQLSQWLPVYQTILIEVVLE
jgi:hypothetical protein